MTWQMYRSPISKQTTLCPRSNQGSCSKKVVLDLFHFTRTNCNTTSIYRRILKNRVKKSAPIFKATLVEPTFRQSIQLPRFTTHSVKMAIGKSKMNNILHHMQRDQELKTKLRFYSLHWSTLSESHHVPLTNPGYSRKHDGGFYTT